MTHPMPSEEHDHLHIGTGPRVDPDPIWSCMGCGQATNHFVVGSLVHPEDGLCERCVAAIRALPPDTREEGLHHHKACPVRGCSYSPDDWNDEKFAASTPRPGLDVERLALALWAWGFEPTGPVVRDEVKRPTEAQRRMARKLANEYDRLAARQAEPPETHE